MRALSVDHIMQKLGSGRGRDSGSEWKMYPCPLASTRHENGRDSHPSLGIHVGDVGASGFKCHACGISGSSLYWLVRACRLDGLIDDATCLALSERIEWVKSHEPDLPDIEEVQPTIDPDVLSDLSTTHPYYRGRHFSDRETLEWRLGARKNMLLLPCVLRDGSIPFIQARLSTEKSFWYLPAGIRRQYVVGTHLLSGKERGIVYTEGIFDAMRVRRALRKLGALDDLGVVCSFGSKPNARQLDHLFSLVKEELVICADNDMAGDLCSDQLEELGRGRVKTVSRVELPKGKDPDSAGTNVLMEKIPSRVNLLSLRMRQLLGV